MNRDLNVESSQKFINTPITSMTLEVTENPRYDPNEVQVGALGETVKYYND